jgi:type IV secretion system protein VirB3
LEGLDRDTLFVALTRPQMLLGVTYGFAIANAIITTELFLIFKSAWVLLAALIVHVIGWLACLRDPHIFDLWLVRMRRCPRVANYRVWQCNSYRPEPPARGTAKRSSRRAITCRIWRKSTKTPCCCAMAG